ncbi:ComEC/Rec2 family competence protein [Micromonospora sp. CPCC 206171]|uniref:ComEC/Rec2 family competence protein n=1 Tax=Micromonospora sp. CPCC 206171 TaxID=3122405 RepID=UPI003FA5675D
MTATRHFFFDVGQGQGSLSVDTGSGEALLVDCAKGTTSEIEQNAAGCKLRLVIVTHLDWDHCADLMNIVRVFDPDSVRLNLDTGWKMQTQYRQLRALIRGLREWSDSRRPARWGFATIETAPDQPKIGSMSWRVLAPEASDVGAAHQADNRNKASVILHLRSNGRGFLFTGDADAAVLGRLVSDDPGQVAADVLVLPHHGGRWRYRTSDPDASDVWPHVGPAIAIISAGSRNDYGHPFPENIQGVLKATQARVMCTQVTPRCFGADSLAAHQEAARGANSMTPPSEAACAGTVQVDVNEVGGLSVAPDLETHGATIRRWPQPCCLSVGSVDPGPE